MNSKNDKPESQKKPYKTPELTVYGGIAVITDSGNPGSHIDSRGPAYGSDRTT